MTEVIKCSRCGGKGLEFLSLKPIEYVNCTGCKGTGRMEVPGPVVVLVEIEERGEGA